MANQKSYLVCPICLHNLPIERAGRERRKYNIWAKEKDSILYIRDCSGGKKAHFARLGKNKPGWPPGSGFPIIERVPWDEALANSEYREVLQEVQGQIQKLAVQILDRKQKQKLIEKLQENQV